jgi:PKD repeat protein
MNTLPSISHPSQPAASPKRRRVIPCLILGCALMLAVAGVLASVGLQARETGEVRDIIQRSAPGRAVASRETRLVNLLLALPVATINTVDSPVSGNLYSSNDALTKSDMSTPTVNEAKTTPTPTPTPTPYLILDPSDLRPNQAAALDSMLFLRDPFAVVNGTNLLIQGSDRNTRAIIFATNLKLAPGETASAILVNLIDSNNRSYDVAAEDFRAVPLFDFSQVIFRLPDNLPGGTCTIRLKAHGQVSNTGTLRILSAGRDMIPPQLSISPANGATIKTTTPLIEIIYDDDQSGIDKTTLTVKIDGNNYTNLFTVTDTKSSYMVSLGGGEHVIEASLKDKEGNLGQTSSKLNVSVFRALPEVTPTAGVAPLTVNFITKAEYTDGAIIRYRWDFQGDGIFDTNDPGARNYSHTFTQKGTFNAVLEVTNDKNQVATQTVPIVVTGSPPVATASLNPSNGAIPLLVNFTGAGTDKDGTIVKFEWDFDGNGTFDFTSTTTGNTTHNYDTAGTFNAVFRVTDNEGLTGTAKVTTTAVRAGPPSSPTATITSPANPLTVTAPNTVSFNGNGTDSDGTITKYEWDFDGNGVYDYSSTTTASTSFKYDSPGIYTAALRVTDNSNLTGIDTIDITVNLPITLSLSTDTCRPLQGGTVNVNTTQAGSTTITIFIRDKAGLTIKTLVNNVPRTAGTYMDTWDCKDSNGAVVPDGPYYAILRYLANGQTQTVDLSNTTGGVFSNPSWNMSTTSGTSCSTCPFSPLSNNFLKVDFTLNKASEISVSIRLFNRVDEVVSLYDRKLFGRGPYTVFWDGTDISGLIVTPPPGETFLWGMTAFTLPDNAIFVETAPQITNVAANPNYFDPSTGNFISPQNPATKISYTLTKQANVSVQVFRSGSNILMRTITQPNAAAGAGTIEWDGRDSNGIFVDKGDYRLAVKATDAAGNQSIVRYVLVRVFY